MLRIKRKIPYEAKLAGGEALIKALVLTEDEVRADRKLEATVKKEEQGQLAKKLYLKASKLDADLLCYLRAHLLVHYEGEDISKIKVIEPSDVSYELLVLKTYEKLLDQIKSERNLHATCHASDIKSELNHRKEIIATFRNE